jgi:UPF0755 protein
MRQAVKRRTSPVRSALIVLAALASAGVLAALAFMSVAAWLDRPPSARTGQEPVLFVVQPGSTGSQVAYNLKKAGLIRSASSFIIGLRLSGRAGSIKAGTYEIGPGMGSRDIADMMVEGRQAVRRLTLPEGLTLKGVARELEGSGICESEDFLAAARDRAVLDEYGIDFQDAQGYLFPDTYAFPLGTDATTILRVLLDRFFSEIRRNFPEAADLPSGELGRRIILASIIEREYRLAEEAPRMASVFYNRLKIGMALQSCATVVYIITDIQGRPHPSELSIRDLEIQNPYNTYLHPGLPPGPISNPGLVALKAAFAPEKTDFLYFRLTDPERGSHTFSRSLEAHNQAGYAVKGGVSGR